MQVIYIDTLLCVNLFIDYIILFTIRKFLHINSTLLRLILGSIFAALTTLGVFLPFYTRLFSVFYRLFAAIVTILIAFGFGSIRKLIIRSLAFLLTGMVLCGVVILFELGFDPKKICVYNDSIYFDISPVTLILVTTATYIVLSIFEKMRNQHNIKSRILSITIHTTDCTCMSFKAMVDTGCKLKEPFSGLPVILAEEELLKSVHIPPERMRLIPFSTASGTGSVYGFRPHKLYIDGKIISSGCYIGICKNKLKGEIKSITGTELAEAI